MAMALDATHRRRLRSLAPMLAVAAVAAAVTASSATAERPKMTVKFASPTVRLAGPGAIVYVKCGGNVASSCVGTLTLEAAGGSAEAPFSIERGARRSVLVPLGSQRRLGGDRRVRAVAETMQARGDSVRTSRLLRIR